MRIINFVKIDTLKTITNRINGKIEGIGMPRNSIVSLESDKNEYEEEIKSNTVEIIEIYKGKYALRIKIDKQVIWADSIEVTDGNDYKLTIEAK